SRGTVYLTRVSSSPFSVSGTAPPRTYSRSLHDALPISALDPLHGPHPDDGRDAAVHLRRDLQDGQRPEGSDRRGHHAGLHRGLRSEEHTSELQSRENLVCRLLLEKKNLRTESRPEACSW